MNAKIWIPIVLGAAGVLMGLALARTWAKLPAWASLVGAVVAVGLGALAIYLAFLDEETESPRGGSGGRALTSGTDSEAIGGRGGDAGLRTGGKGGEATAKGKRSRAKGGDGGRG